MIQVTRFTDPASLQDRLRLHGAEPREKITGELLGEIRRGSPWAKLEPGPTPGGCEVLTIWDDFGHRYIYRVVEWHFEQDVYDLEWPD